MHKRAACDAGGGGKGMRLVEREEELAYVRDWFPALVDLYRRCADAGRVIVCETLS